MNINIPDDWLPTSENINALPGPLFEYIRNIETLCDPAGIIAENTLLRDQNRQLGCKLYEVKGFAQRVNTFLKRQFFT